MIKIVYELGLSHLVRALIIYFSLTFSVFFIWLLSKKCGLNGKKTVLVSILGYLFMIACALPNSFAFGLIEGNDFILDIFYVPLTMIHGLPFYMIASVPLCRLFKLDHRRVNDISAIGFILCQGISHFGCIFVGCCSGFPSDFGIYNPLLDTTLFPVQIFDGLSALIIAFLLLLYLRKKDYCTGGYLYPIMLMSYGVVRFLWELARTSKKVLNIFTYSSVYCVIMVVIGAFSFLLMYSYNKERNALLERKKK